MKNSDLIGITETRRLLGGVSDMFVWRRLKDDPSFPRPIRYAKGGPRYWRRGEIEDWIESHREVDSAHDYLRVASGEKHITGLDKYRAQKRADKLRDIAKNTRKQI